MKTYSTFKLDPLFSTSYSNKSGHCILITFSSNEYLVDVSGFAREPLWIEEKHNGVNLNILFGLVCLLFAAFLKMEPARKKV